MVNKQNNLRKQIGIELSHLTELGPMLKGSVCEVKQGRSKEEQGERTRFLLTYKGKGNKTKSVYVPLQRIGEVQEMIAKHQEAKRIIEKVIDLSVALFKNK